MLKMQSLENCEEAAEYLIETARLRPEKLVSAASASSKWKSIHEKLIELYLKENRKELSDKNLVSSSKLLEKLVRRDSLNTLVVNLYAGDEGFSLALRNKANGDVIETLRLPYEESEFLDHVDNEELPSMLVDLLDRVQTNVFYSGCVICELRDYRRTVNLSCSVSYVLLRPTSHSLLNDINTLTCDGHRWTQEDKHTLESQLLLATAEPLCLDPSPTVFFLKNKLTHEKHKFNTPAIRRNAKKYSEVALNRKRCMATAPSPTHLKLHEFLNGRKHQARSEPHVNLKVAKTCVDTWRQREVPLTAPANIDVERYARPLQRTKPTIDNTPLTVETYTFETEKKNGKINFSRLTILQRLSDELYFGELYVDRDYTKGRSDGSTCKFPLGTIADVIKYINQFREIFTEEGRRQVLMTHCLPGQEPTVLTPNMVLPQHAHQRQATTNQQSSNIGHQGSVHGQTGSNQGAANASLSVSIPAQNAQQALLQAARTLTGQIGLSRTGADAGKKIPPLKLSLSNNPQGNISAYPASSPALSTGQLGNASSQLTQQQITSQKMRQMGLMSSQLRSNSAPSTPNQHVSTPSATLSIPNFSGSFAGNATLTLTSSSGPTLQITPQSSFAKPTQSATPPPNVTITMATSIPMIRRSSNTDTTARGGSHLSIPASDATTHASADPSGTANQILASISSSSAIGQSMSTQAQSCSVPQNINIQSLAGLQGINITNLQALQNIQVSVSGQHISVPLGVISNVNQHMHHLGINQSHVNQINVNPITASQTMSHLNVNQSSINQNVNQLTLNQLNSNQNVNQVNVNTLNVNQSVNPLNMTQNINQLNLSQGINVGSLHQSGITMSTPSTQQPLQSNFSQSSRMQAEQLLGAGDAPLSAVMATTVNTPSQAQSPLHSHMQGPTSASMMGAPNMLSLPIGVAGNITQFMTSVGLKGAQGIRPGTPFLLSQVQGQQPVQILSTGSNFSQGNRLQIGGSPATTPVKHHPGSPSGSTGLLSPASVAAHSPQHMSPFSPIRQGQGQSQQFVQLAPQSSVTHLTIQGGAATPTKPKKRLSQAMSPRL